MLERYAVLTPNHPLFAKKPDDIRKHIASYLGAAIYVDVTPFETTVPQSQRDYSYSMRSNGFSATFMPVSPLQARNKRVYVLKVACELPSENGHPIFTRAETADESRVADAFSRALGVNHSRSRIFPEDSLARRLQDSNKSDIIRYISRLIGRIDVFEEIS